MKIEEMFQKISEYVKTADNRVKELRVKRKKLLKFLIDRYKQPLASKILNAFEMT